MEQPTGNYPNSRTKTATVGANCHHLADTDATQERWTGYPEVRVLLDSCQARKRLSAAAPRDSCRRRNRKKEERWERPDQTTAMAQTRSQPVLPAGAQLPVLQHVPEPTAWVLKILYDKEKRETQILMAQRLEMIQNPHNKDIQDPTASDTPTITFENVAWLSSKVTVLPHPQNAPWSQQDKNWH